MKILQISDLAPPHLGGVERVVWKYSTLLANRGNDVSILTSLIKGSKSKEEIENVRFFRVPKYMLLFSSLYTKNFEIVHTHSYLSFPILGFEKKLRDTPVIKHIHSVYGEELEEFTGWSVSKIFSKMERYLVNADCSAYIVPSNFTRSRLLDMGVKKEIYVVPHGVEYNYFPPKEIARKRIGINENSKVIGFIGRMSMGKGPQDIAKIWADIKKEIPNAILIFVGPEPDISTSGIKGNTDFVKKILIENNSIKDVIFAGKVEDDILPYYISAFDVYVAPSLNEGFGISILNSMAAGVPVVAYKNTAIPEIVDDTGILVETKNLEKLKESIINVIEDENLRKELSLRSKERASSYTWEKSVEKLLEIYSQYV
jgi:Glycosyltransferase